MSHQPTTLQTKNKHNVYNPFDLGPETLSTYPQFPCRYNIDI